MSIIEALLIAIALAMDCFTVSLTCGIIQRRMGMQAWGMAAMFGFFQSLMAYLGWATIGVFSQQLQAYDHWIVFAILGMLGVKMIWDGLHPKERPRIDPSRFIVLLMLSVATSVDALAVGCSFVGMGLHSFHWVKWPFVMIGVASFVMSFFGKYIGVKIGHRLDWPAEQLGGMILIIIGLKILIQHLAI